MRIDVDRALCCGSGQCVLEAPEVFELDEEGLSSVHRQPTDADSRSRAAAAADNCPTLAITTSEGD